ncbi:MAG: DUF1501 domain-containing protein [Candidatus Hydrogenedentes bacterium]|nr:DUF1501 domain-containing protein [Candidatus Hydrogenedentota bacterium]
MHPIDEKLLHSRRSFLATAASGLGSLAMASLLQQDEALAASTPDAINPLAPRSPHFAPRAKRCIFIFLEGAPSQMDLFDPKPELNRLNGQPVPESLTKDIRFAFIQKETAVILGSPRTFTKHGQSGMDFSDLLPNIARHADDICMIRSMHTEAFNHHPGQLMMNTGVQFFGRPSMGSWINYGLGSESQNLPGYVVLTCGRGTSGGVSNWGSGFLPSTYQGVLFRNQGDPVLHLGNPGGLTHECQRRGLNAARELNAMHYEQTLDPEVLARISAYELAFRMQSAAPDLIDFSSEPQYIRDAYGLDRKDTLKSERGGPDGTYAAFSANCLLARRLVERGVRFVNLYHASWDHHSSLDSELKYCTGMADQPIAALLADLKNRGLLEDTLVVWGSEFGRTPLGENRVGRDSNTGRDHHPSAFTIWAAGGGLKGGHVHGETDDIGWNITKDPVHINDFHATLLHLFGMDHLKLTYRHSGRDFRLTDVAGDVVRPLLA